MKTKQNRLLFVIICITILFATLTCQAQSDYEKSNNLSVISAPGTYIDFGHENYTNDGFNIGVTYTYQNPVVYVGAELFHFPKLNNLTYTHLVGKAGLNLRINNQLNDPIVKFHAGGRAGFIARESVDRLSHLLGLETGLTFYIPNTDLYIGGYYAYDIKTDSKPLWSEDKHSVNSFFVEIGIRF